MIQHGMGPTAAGKRPATAMSPGPTMMRVHSLTRLTSARTASKFQGHSRACVACCSWGGRRHRRCPHTSTTPGRPHLAAAHRASCTQGVQASARGP